MRRSGTTGQRLAATFMLGWMLLNYPLLSLFAREDDVGGVPLLYAYVFSAWTLLIVIMALVVERRPRG